MRQPDEKSFLKDVAKHKMTVLHESEMYRHLRFSSGSFNMQFDLVTWPGMLTICGDMGTWVFSRLPDMFDFFRSSKLEINPYYWSEKLQHGNFSGRTGGKVWDADSFKEKLLAMLKDNYGFKGKKLKEITQAVKDEIFIHEDEGPYAMPQSAYNFKYVFESDRDQRSYTEKLLNYKRENAFEFGSTDIPDGMVYSYHFLWCCYAIVWGIQQWDAREPNV